MSDVHDEYVAGDVNTIDDEGDEYDEVDVVDEGNEAGEGFGGAERAATASATLTFIAKSLAEDPSAVSVDVSERHDKVVLSLSVGPNDMGRIIGRRGRTAQAIRALVGAAGARDGVTTSVDIVD
ncbi:MAG: KH domain-containing protein [Acidimicrobiales bacterium]|jgi:predicted RNA-binding protein YlqC (UPF0109 family)